MPRIGSPAARSGVAGCLRRLWPKGESAEAGLAASFWQVSTLPRPARVPFTHPGEKTAAEGHCRRDRVRSACLPVTRWRYILPCWSPRPPGRPCTRDFALGWRAPRLAAPAPAGGRGGLDTGRPAHVKCLHQATGSCGARGIDEESALPIEAIASRRLSRPIGAQPHRLIERVSGRVSDPLGISHQARASRARPLCSRASPSDRALPPPSMRTSKMRPHGMREKQHAMPMLGGPPTSQA